MGLTIVTRAPEPLQLVRAIQDDFDAYLEIEKAIEEKTPRKFFPDLGAEAADFFAENVVRFIVYEGQRVGILSHQMKPPSHIEITEVGIHPDYWRKRIAYKALKLALSCWRTVHVVELVVHPENPAKRLYIMVGFSVEERLLDYWGDGEPRDRMVWEHRHLIDY